ncbi:VanZ family protein [Oerskovia enterophila]|uniref:VanZ family protein n=1 Tax=Oerskovia enterophila TaxID=43678 RepID=UPI00382686D1
MRTLRWTFAVYLAAVLVVTCWPSPESTAAPGWALAVVDVFRAVGLPMTVVFLEAASNVVMFLPFGVLGLLLLTGPGARGDLASDPARGLWRRAGLVVLAGFALSLAIELTQLLIPGRYSTVQDVVLNTTGAALGAAAAAGLLALRRARPAPSTS